MIFSLPIVRNIHIPKNNKKGNAKNAVKMPCHPIVVPTMTTPRSLNAQSDIYIQNIERRKNFEGFLNKKGKVTLEEYEDIKKNHPSILIEAQKYIEDCYNHKAFKTKPQTAAILSFLAKQKLDLLCGKDGYKLISIGTSPSFITESMSQLGANIVFLPISGAANIEKPELLDENLKEYPNLAHCGNYLLENGINKDEIEDKTVILLDYTYKGTTLNTVEDLVQNYCGIPSNQIEKENMTRLLYSLERIAKRKNIKINANLNDINDDMRFQRPEFMSNTPHYYIFENGNRAGRFAVATGDKDESTLFSEFDSFSKPSARAYQLCVLHELNKLKRV